LCGQLGLLSVEIIPVSALEGDNVVTPSKAMPWYAGPTLLEYLETVPLALAETAGPMRFPVQLVLRPDASFRGFAGQVARGTLRAGDRVMALPSRRETIVRRIVTYDGDLPAASYPQSVTVELEDEIDLSRGEMLVAAESAGESLPDVSNRFRAMVVWMHEDPLVVGRTYIAKHTTRTVRATVRTIRYRVDVNSLNQLTSDSISMNEIAEVEFETNLPLFFDSYRACRWTGSLILIDALTNATVGAAMIAGALENVEQASAETETASLILLSGRPDRAARVRDALLDRGDRAILIDDPLVTDSAVPSVVRALELAGVIAISARALPQAMLAEIEAFAGVMRVEADQDEVAIINALGDR
jgi:bifunctional enzyme CysN/CysC/sulfate adenylyltransferase subunit 1